MCSICKNATPERARHQNVHFSVPGQLLEASIRPDTSVLSVMTVNNEIGVQQPIEEIGNHGNRLHVSYYSYFRSGFLIS